MNCGDCCAVRIPSQRLRVLITFTEKGRDNRPSAMDLISVAAFLISILITVWILIPVVGVVTRFRINYTPKGVGLGEAEEGDGQRLSQDMRVGPVVNSVGAARYT